MVDKIKGDVGRRDSNLQWLDAVEWFERLWRIRGRLCISKTNCNRIESDAQGNRGLGVGSAVVLPLVKGLDELKSLVGGMDVDLAPDKVCRDSVEFKLSEYAKVRTAALEGPEKISILLSAGIDNASIGQDNLQQ